MSVLKTVRNSGPGGVEGKRIPPAVEVSNLARRWNDCVANCRSEPELWGDNEFGMIQKPGMRDQMEIGFSPLPK